MLRDVLSSKYMPGMAFSYYHLKLYLKIHQTEWVYKNLSLLKSVRCGDNQTDVKS